MKILQLKTKLSLSYAFVVLLTVAMLCALSNYFINKIFKNYIVREQAIKTETFAQNLTAQYDGRFWNLDSIHSIGMYALYDGYIIKMTDSRDMVLWDAEVCDMSGCMEVMSDIVERMKTKYGKTSGEFTTKIIPLTQGDMTIGYMDIRYYGPYFLSDNDFQFLNAFNTALVIVGTFSLILSVMIGLFMASRISRPVHRAAEFAIKMSGGDFNVITPKSTGTKELDELLHSINSLAKSLSCQENLRKQLTADVAHELRTPITTAQTHLEAMMEGLWEVTPENLTSCHEEISRLGTIVGDLEGLARAEHELALNKTEFNLLNLAERTIACFAPEIESKNLLVTLTGESAKVYADEDRIKQVVVNLLSNAIKFTHAGGNIDIIVSQIDCYAVLEVSDSGIGIPKEELPFVFERFYRADKSRNRKTGGTGLGLAIAKAIVTAHGGKIMVTNNETGGCSFRVMIETVTSSRNGS